MDNALKRRLRTVGLAAVLLSLGACAFPRVEVAPFPQPGEAAALDGAGHVNPEDPGLPNGGE